MQIRQSVTPVKQSKWIRNFVYLYLALLYSFIAKGDVSHKGGYEFHVDIDVFCLVLFLTSLKITERYISCFCHGHIIYWLILEQYLWEMQLWHVHFKWQSNYEFSTWFLECLLQGIYESDYCKIWHCIFEVSIWTLWNATINDIYFLAKGIYNIWQMRKKIYEFR